MGHVLQVMAGAHVTMGMEFRLRHSRVTMVITGTGMGRAGVAPSADANTTLMKRILSLAPSCND